MFQVQHLMVEQIFNSASRSIGPVEDAADHDGVVRGVIMTQHAAGVVCAPGQCGTSEQAVEEAHVQRFEDLIEIVVVTDGGEDALASAGLANMFGLSGDEFGLGVAAVAVCVRGGNGLLVELRQQDIARWRGARTSGACSSRSESRT